MDNLRKARRTLDTASRAAQAGDVVSIDFEGSIGGEPFAGGKGEKVELEIGAGQFLPDLEQAVIGHAAGESFDAEVAFPADYRAEELRGKTARFAVILHEVKEVKLPEIDGEFLKAHGVEEGAGAEGLPAKCRAAMEVERDKATRTRVKREVLDQLLATNPIEVPQSQVEQEVNRLREEAANRMQLGRASKGKLTADKLQKMPRGGVCSRPTPARGWPLGLRIGEVNKARDIKADPARVDRALDEIAADYDQSQQVKQFYRSRPDMMQTLNAVALEEQVVESLLAGARTVELKLPLEELLKSVQQAAA